MMGGGWFQAANLQWSGCVLTRVGSRRPANEGKVIQHPHWMDEMQWLPVVQRHTRPRFWSSTSLCVLASVYLLPAVSGSLRGLCHSSCMSYVLAGVWGCAARVQTTAHLLCLFPGSDAGVMGRTPLDLTGALPAQGRQFGCCLPVNMHHNLGYISMPCVPPHSPVFSLLQCCHTRSSQGV